MIRNATALNGFTIGATDGDVGSVITLYFDDARWTVRYLVVDTGGWLSGRQVLISPASLGQPDWQGQRIPARLTRAQVEGAPDVDTHRTISREHEAAFAKYYGVPYYWAGPSLWGAEPFPIPVDLTDQVEREAQARLAHADPRDAHLHGTDEVIGHSIHALDGDLGHVEDFLVDDIPWTIRYLVVATGTWWPGKRVLVAPNWIRGVSWQKGTVDVSLTRDAIQGAPEYDRARPVDRDYEIALYAHYDRPRYWAERPAA